MSYEGPGFTAELHASPEDLRVGGANCGHLGFSFADFTYLEEGHADVWVKGVQIGACRSPRGVSMGHGATTLDLLEDTIIARSPGSYNTAWWQNGFHGQFFVFAPEAIERFFELPLSRIAFVDTDIVVPVSQQPSISHLLAAVSAELEAGNPTGPVYLESLSSASLCSIVRVAEQDVRATRGLTIGQAKIIRDTIFERSAEPLSLVDLAESVDLSVGHMLRSFKTTFGVTPHQYIIRERIECAVKLLKSTSLSFEQIAVETGFVTKARMIRTFRTVLGVSPKDVR